MINILITFSNGETFAIPAEVVAKARADYYAGRDCKDDASLKFEDVYRSEFEATMDDDFELLDWFNNNMNWSDVAFSAVRVVSPIVYDYDGEFCHADVSIAR
jgi:hypothetical protein